MTARMAQGGRWFVFLMLLGMISPALAANPSGGLSIELIIAYNLVVDSNIETPAGRSPTAAYIGVKFCNTGTDTLYDVFMHTGNFASNMPGVFPITYTNKPGPGLSPFSLTFEGGPSNSTEDATRYIDSLPPGECHAVYWLVSYPLMDSAGNALFDPLSVNPDDDLRLYYDIWATAENSAASVTSNVRGQFTLRNEITAMANKILPNNANKVPQEYLDLLEKYVPSWTNSAYDGSVGTRIFTEGYWYDLGVINQGFDNNGDLVPDYNAWMQPVGDASIFDPSCFRLVKTYAMVVLKGVIPGGGITNVYIVEDQLYFENMPENSGAIGLVMYEFLPLKANCYSALTPYQEVASGRDNEKFNADYGIGFGFQSGTSTVIIVKGADKPIVIPGSNISYYIAFTNWGKHTAGSLELGTPLVVQDSIPDGTTYVPGSATNNNVLPNNAPYYVVLFSTNNGLTWTDTEPTNPTNVTDVQWWLGGGLESNTAGQVGFDVTVNPNYTNSSPQVCNTACISYGDTDPFACDTVCTDVQGTNRLGDTVWRDDGAGGGFLGNQVQDGAEQGISNVTVWLYRDTDGDGVRGSSDILFRTNTTGAAGYYMFSNLLDGAYIAVVDWQDADLPYGYTPTTPINHWADLDSARTNPAAVVYLDADFGFAPALVLDKALVGTNRVYEGRQVTFDITVTNRLEGDGTVNGGPRTYTVWCTNLDVVNSGSKANELWTNIPCAYSPPYPDGQWAFDNLNNVNEILACQGMNLGTHAGTVTNVQLVFKTWTNGTTTCDTTISLIKNGVTFWTLTTNNSFYKNGESVIDVTSASNWTWADFSTTNISWYILNKKSGNPGGQIMVDIGGFRVTGSGSNAGGTASTTLDPVPLTDRYPSNLLQYVSAVPTPTYVTNFDSGFGKMYWDNVGPIYPGGSVTVRVNFLTLEPPTNTVLTVTNYCWITNATFQNGIPANQGTDEVPVVIYPAGSIGDYIWRDLNKNGLQDDGASNVVGIANVKVVLTPPTNVDVGAGLGIPMTNTTDRNGWYLFTGIPSTGRYTVAVITNTLPGVWTNTADEDYVLNSWTIVSNLNPTATNGLDKHLTADFGYWMNASLDGTVWHDLNRSGTSNRDAGEEWITGVVVRLYYSTNLTTALATNRTDANGYFIFNNLQSNTYTVIVSTNEGTLTNAVWYQSFDTDGTGTAHRATVNVPLGTVGHVDYSYYQVGLYIIGDTVFYDWDGNGVQNTNNEEGIPNISVYLYEDRNSNNFYDVGTDGYIGMQVTATNGYYLFTNRPPTNYLVVVDQADPDFPPSFTCTADPTGVKDSKSLFSVTTSNRLDQDFGYQPYGAGAIGDWVWYDRDGDGVQDVGEQGIDSITVSLYVDANRDGTYVLQTSAVTDVTGWYLFSGLADALYRVTVNAADPDLPTNSFGFGSSPTTVTNYNIEIINGNTNLTADFGFVLPGVLGDTIFWDLNENGTQDWNEDGATNVTVQLYYDADNNGVYDSGTDILLQTTSTDSNGIYHFTGLWPSNYLVYVIPTGTLAGSYLSADPDNDGLPCSDPAATNCDGAYGYDLDFNEVFLGADFGYVPPGVIGDLVWIDQNDNGVRDGGEQGIPYITVWLYSNSTLVATTETDPDGWYAFGNLLDGSFRVVVNTNDADFPTNRFAGLYANYDYDGVDDSRTTNILISIGVVTQISGIGCSDCNLDVDFGYRFPGTNVLSGTIGLDGLPYDGRMGTGASGYSSNEAPFVGVAVYLKLWNDDGDGIIESGEYIDLMSTQTDTNGDYLFMHMPTGDGDDRYIVSIAAPRENLIMTTTNGSTEAPVLWVTNNVNVYGETRSAYQVLTIQSVTTNIDFAFRLLRDYDFGDLPASYSTLLQSTPAGPQNQVLFLTNLYLGATVDTEVNGQPNSTATGDGADEDGVLTVTNVMWIAGTTGNLVRVTVGKGSGWLVGYIDFNNDGDLRDSGELIIDQAVTTGAYTFAVTVPPGTPIYSNQVTALYSRFRLFPSEPFVPEFAFSASADNGEVEDYRWLLGVIADTVWEDTNTNGVRDLTEPPLTNILVYVDLNTNGVRDTGEPYTRTETNGNYYLGGFSAGNFMIRVDPTTLPDTNYYPVYDLDGGTDNVARTTIGAGEIFTNMDFGYQYPTPTYAVISRFEAFAIGGQVVVEWETAAEVDTVGFNLLRKDGGTDAFRLVNDKLLPALLDSPQGGVYRLVDPSAKPGRTYTYQINEVEGSGHGRAYGPFTVTPAKQAGLSSGAKRQSSAENFARSARVSESAQRRLAGNRKTARAAVAVPSVPPSAVKMLGASSWKPVKLTLNKPGVYRVDALAVAEALGVKPTEVLTRISNRTVRVTCGASECRYLPAVDGVYFYAEAMDSLYTTNNAYWLRWSAGTAMAARDGTAPAPVEGGTFTDTLHVESDVIPVTTSTKDPESDYWYWNYLIAGFPPLDHTNYVFDAPGAAGGSGQATLVVRLYSATTVGMKQEHHVQVSVNGTAVGEALWDGLRNLDLTNRFSQSLLAEAGNTVSVTALLESGVPYSILYVDSFDVQYQRRCEAVDDQLLVRGDGRPVVTVSGFSSAGIRVLDVSDPLRPVVQNGVTVDESGGRYRASFVPAGPAVPYELFAEATAGAPVSMAAVPGTGLRSLDNEAEYVVITVPELQAEAQRLADYRGGKGLSSKVVLLGDLYDEFNYGWTEAPAIRTFLTYAARQWAVPPRYVVLAGEGTYDYRNLRGTGDNLVPTMMAAGPQGIFPSDGWYADLNQDRVPDMAVGRIPALSAAELGAFIDKLIGYEDGEGGSWKQSVLLAADNADDGGDFQSASEDVEGYMPRDYSVQRLYLADHTVPQARSLLKEAVDDGVVFLNYFGHGALDLLAAERLLQSADVAAWANAGRLPVMVSLTCMVGQYALPGFDCLSEVLLLSSGGAVASWSPTGLSINQEARILATHFYRAIFRDGETVLGNAIVRAMRQYAKAGGGSYLLLTYNLLGDPASRLQGVAFLKPNSTLENWQDQEFTYAQLGDTGYSAFDADPDGDGVQNLMEYAMGWNPHVADGDPRLMMLGPWEVNLNAAGKATVWYQRRKAASDVEFQLQSSRDLLNWSPAGAYVTDTLVKDNGDGQTETVRVRLSAPPQAGGERLFIRLRLSKF